MEPVIAWALDIASGITVTGVIGIIVGILVFVGQWVLCKETQATWKELKESITAYRKNWTRRWQSEDTRMRERIQELRDAGTDESNDLAWVRSVSIYLKRITRVTAGLVEDTGNLIVAIFLMFAPLAIGIYRRVVLGRKRR